MKFSALILFLLFQNICFAQNTVLIEIHAPKFKNGAQMQIYEGILVKKPIKSYDLQIINGKSVKEIVTGKGDRFFIRFNQQNLGIYFEPGVVKINIRDTTLADAMITGSKSNEEMDQWLIDWKKEPIYTSTRIAQNKWFEKNNEEVTALLKTKYDSVKKIFDKHMVNFNMGRIRANPGSYINSILIHRIMDLVSTREVSYLYEELNKEAQDNTYGKFIKYTIDSLYINGTIPGFEQSDTSGNQVRLVDFRGKYVLLDFWASWCIPCRAENPNLIKAYEQFKHRNFTILGISIDSERKLWIDAIKKDKLTWTQISDLKGWDNSISRKYVVRAVPSNFLISPEGKIIARNIRGEELIETLEKTLQ